jgi:hypothetical protein
MKNIIVVCLIAAISAVFVIESAHAASLANLLVATTY